MEEKAVEERLFMKSVFELEPGLAIIQMRYQGEGSFVIDLLPAEGEWLSTPEQIEFSGRQDGSNSAKAVLARADRKGPVDISRAVRIPDAGEYVSEVQADGPWTVDIEQPTPSGAPWMASFSDDTATPFFQLTSGSKEVTTSTLAGGDLKVSLLDMDKDGNEIAPVSSPETSQARGDPAASSTVYIPDYGIYLFDVRADNLWTVEITDSE